MFHWLKRFFEKVSEVNATSECGCSCGCCEISEEELTEEALAAGCKCCTDSDNECNCGDNCGCKTGNETDCCNCNK